MLIGSCFKLTYTCCRERFNALTLEEFNRARDNALGPRHNRSAEKGSLPVERYEDGTLIGSVKSSERCYPLGITNEKPTAFSAPNANSKIVNNKVDANTQCRADLLKVCLRNMCISYV